MHWLGLLGAPRRVPLAGLAYADASWAVPQALTAIGGSIMFIGAIFYFYAILATVLGKEKASAPVEMPVAESEVSPSLTPAWLDNWTTWIVASVVLVVIGYGPILIDMLGKLNMVSPGFRVW